MPRKKISGISQTGIYYLKICLGKRFITFHTWIYIILKNMSKKIRYVIDGYILSKKTCQKKFKEISQTGIYYLKKIYQEKRLIYFTDGYILFKLCQEKIHGISHIGIYKLQYARKKDLRVHRRIYFI